MKNSQKLIIVALLFCQVTWTNLPIAEAAPPGPLDLVQSPLFYGLQQKPIVMLNLTKDHQLHFKAYTDYSDLDGDGIPELTYKHSFDYYGYWDSGKCYSYSAANGGVYSPTGFSADKYCGGTGWSGNFLNWVATSRLDSVRKILYGGKRSTDTATSTVIERSFLTMDAHSWAKFYDGADLNKLIPATILGTFTTTASGTTYTDNSGSVVTLTDMATATNYFIRSTISARVGDQIKLTQATPGVIRYGRVTAISGTLLTVNIPNATVGVIGVAAPLSLWQLENLSATGVTFCNTTFVGNGNSTTAVAAPLIRVSRGNTELWAANERWQCGFQGEKASNSGGGFAAGGQNGNYFPLSGLKSNAESPPNNAFYKVADYTARVEACKDQTSTFDTTETWSRREGCKAYGAQWKPVGLLQKQTGFKFGLFTGSYAKNISGGVLRSNVGDFDLEVDSNGVFIDPSASAALTAKGSIVKAIDAIRMTGYNYGDGAYITFDGNCTYQLIDLVPTGASGNKRNQGACSSWGNPIAEMYTESLRYLAGASADPNFTYSGATVDDTLGLKIITWQDPINTNNYCVPLRNIIFNAATTSYDGDQVNMTGLYLAGTAASYTNIIGAYEGITSGIVGKLPSTPVTSATFNTCTNKTGALADFRGICPEGAPYSGSYLTAGSAYYARNNKIRSSPPIPASATSLFPSAYTVETYGVSLANNTPKIDILSVDGKSILATITPAYRLDKGDGVGGGTIVDFKIIEVPDFSKPVVKGVYYINWEDSGFGGDFDQDVIGRIEFSFDRAANKLAVTTAATNASTANPQGFGYVLSGTGTVLNPTDGPHFHSGILTFNYTNPVTGLVECTNCQAGQSPTTQTYTLSGISGTSLKDPLYYAAKWGALVNATGPKGDPNSPLFDLKGKKDFAGNDLPDGIPDNYFNVSNPAKLAQQLESLFAAIASTSSSSSAAASTTRASSDTLAFTASFNGEKWSGALKAFSLNVGPPVVFTEQWDASAILNTRTTARKLFTTNSDTRAGTTFEWSNLSTTQQAALVSQPIQKYVAGDRSNEGTLSTNFRVRGLSALGDIVNSNPAYSADRADFGGAFGRFPGYAAFSDQFDVRKGGTRRTKALYVGANDGMLHAFTGDSTANSGGTELFAYVPSMIYNKLSLLSRQDYTVSGNHRYFVDGSPFVSDANVASASAPNWKTVLLGGLGAGGAGYFALDVTNPDTFDSGKVMWEFTAADALNGTKSDLGASLAQARIGRTNVGGESWFAVFGNGYNSTLTPTNGQAVLFAARLGKTGAAWTLNSDFYRLVVSTGPDNGLSAPTLIDYDRDGFVDFIYAGDLQGNLWRIDARNANPSAWTSKKLFATPTGQPITVAPQVTRHPNGGLIIMFGTGKYLEVADVNVIPPVQTLYGIIDLDPTNASAVTQTVSNLNTVPIVAHTLPIAGATAGQCKTDKGWYANLQNGGVAEGERNVFDSALVAGSLFTPTLIPSNDLCLGGGRSFLYCINPFTGCACDATQATAIESAGIQSTPRFIAISPALAGRNDSTGGGRSVQLDSSGRQITSQKVILLGNAEGAPVSLGGNVALPISSGRLSWREIVDQPQ
jgi:type IV pilus assembly protein PilY1